MSARRDPLDADLATRIEAALGARPAGIQRLGGSWGAVSLLAMPDGRRLVAKTAAEGLALEGRMLRYLAERSDLPVPTVHASADDLLILDYLEGGGGLDDASQAHAADLIAGLHAITQPTPGLDFDTLIGPLHQPNTPSDTWLAFFRDQRLLSMADVAARAGRLPSRTRARLDRLADKLDRLLEEPPACALLHGDLWGGNVLASHGRISGFIDPAIYHGHREIELAFTTLFGTFGDPFFARYRERAGLDAAWLSGFQESRRDLYNLYPLLVHVRLFGGSYLGGVERVLDRHGC